MAKIPGYYRKRGQGWQVVIRFNGQRYQYGPREYEELRGATENEVREFVWREYRRLEEQATRKAAGAPGPCRFSELLAQFEAEELPTLAPGTQDAYRDSFKPIRAYFIEELGDPTVDRIFARHVRSFLSWRRVNRLDGRAPLSNRTLAKDRAVLHRLFSFAERLEYRDGNPVARVPAPKWDGRDPVILSEEQYEALIEAAGDYDMLRLYVLVLGESGCRSESEALYLQWDDVDLDEGFLWIASGRNGHRTKSGKGRWVPMTPRLRQAMKEHFARYRFARYDGKPTPWIFHHTTTRRHARAGERIRSMRRSLMAAAKRAKLPDDWHPHDLRHRRVTTWLAEGANPVHVKEAVGHSDLRTTMGYTHLAREHLRSLVEKQEEVAIAKSR